MRAAGTSRARCTSLYHRPRCMCAAAPPAQPLVRVAAHAVPLLPCLCPPGVMPISFFMHSSDDSDRPQLEARSTRARFPRPFASFTALTRHGPGPLRSRDVRGPAQRAAGRAARRSRSLAVPAFRGRRAPAARQLRVPPTAIALSSSCVLRGAARPSARRPAASRASWIRLPAQCARHDATRLLCAA